MGTLNRLVCTTSFVVLCQLILLMMVQLSSSQTTTSITPLSNTTEIPSTSTSDSSLPCKPEFSCEDCVKVAEAKCYYCNSNVSGLAGCRLYPAEHVFPKSSECPLADARWGVCWVNFEALIIAMSVLAGVLILSIGCSIYCCCCRSKSKVDVHELRWDREASERQQRHADRRVEREAKMNTIRQKYGLNRDTAAYNRMDE